MIVASDVPGTIPPTRILLPSGTDVLLLVTAVLTVRTGTPEVIGTGFAIGILSKGAIPLWGGVLLCCLRLPPPPKKSNTKIHEFPHKFHVPGYERMRMVLLM
eukprot:2367502-Rhodomonas_salina.1